MYKFNTDSHLRLMLSVLNPLRTPSTHSRFESFFNNEAERRTTTKDRSHEEVSPANSRKKTFHFNIDKVTQGIDNRTTVMIKNISHSLTKERLRNILTSYCECNYIYIPTNAKKKLLGFAFVNVVNTQELVKLYQIFQTKEESMLISAKKPADICYSKMQGINKLIKAFGEEN